MKRRQFARPGKDSNFPQVNSELIEIGESQSDSDSEEETASDFEPTSHRKLDSITSRSRKSPRREISQNDKINSTLEKMKSIASTYHSTSSEKVFFTSTCSILEYVTKIVESFTGVEFYQSFSNDYDSLRFISENDETRYLSKEVINVEGILPLPSVHYKQAINFKPDKHKAENIVYNIIRLCFPEHWISNVTLRGSGGRTSLISIWNHVEPLRWPLGSPVDPNLGERRFRALLGKLFIF